MRFQSIGAARPRADRHFTQGDEMVSRNTVCLWYDGTALDAATFYAQTFPDSAVGAVHRAPATTRPAGRATS